MKPHFKPPCTILATALAAALHAAVPLAWEVRPTNTAPAAFDRHHGETIHLTATFNGFGELPFAPEADVRLWYQTNGMGQAWWSAPATVQSNVLSATWSPALDPGADRVSLFFGAPSNVYASAVLRLRHSPGFSPSELTLPVQRLDFAAVEIANAPYYTKPETDAKIVELAPPTSLAPATNYTDHSLSSFAATGAVARALSYGTTNRWTDAAGCVWEVTTAASWRIDPPLFPGIEGIDEDAGKPIYLSDRHRDGYWWVPMVGDWAIGDGKGNSDSTNISWTGGVEAVIDITATREFAIVTNLVGRVALKNDIAEATNALHEAIAPTIDYSTSNTTLVATIEAKAPAPGNYSAVSNAAMSAAAQTNDFLRLTGGTMTGDLGIFSGINFFYGELDGPRIYPFTPGALAFGSRYSEYADRYAILDLERLPENTAAEIAFLPEVATPETVTNIVRELSLGGIWDAELEVWWTPVMSNGALTYQATTNVNLNSGN